MPTTPEWRKSSYSGGGTGSCVEVAVSTERVGVRDSKNVDGPRLAFAVVSWRMFVSGASEGGVAVGG